MSEERKRDVSVVLVLGSMSCEGEATQGEERMIEAQNDSSS